jgi:hypothetical protein
MKISADHRTRASGASILVFTLLAGSLLLSACGGDGGGGSGSGPPPSYTIGGSASGLAGSVVLQNNGGDNLTVSANGNFSFATRLNGGAAYAVTVLTQPVSQVCTVQSGSGTASTNVNTVTVNCQTLLRLSSSTPASAATGVARDVQLVLVFSAALDAASVAAANITLSGGGGTVSADYQVSGAQVTVRPLGKLKPLTQYTLTAGIGVRGQSGEILSAAVTRQFTTRERVWGVTQLIENEAGAVNRHQVAAAGAGNAFAVWVQVDGDGDGARNSIWSNRYAAEAGWGTAQRVEAEDVEAYYPQVAVDASGNAIVVWAQYNASGVSIWSNRYTAGAGTGWGTARLIETNDASSNEPQVGMDANGNAIVVWAQYEASGVSIWSNHYAANTSWGTAQRIAGVENRGGSAAVHPSVAVGADGVAIVVWDQADGTGYSIWSSRLVAGGWNAAHLIGSGAGEAGYPRVSVDAEGKAIVVWHQYVDASARFETWANRYLAAGAAWGSAQRIDSATGHALFPRVAMDVDGNATVVWTHFDDTGGTSIWLNRYVAGFGWSTAQAIEGESSGEAGDPQVAVDANGDVTVVWIELSATSGNNIRSKRLE